MTAKLSTMHFFRPSALLTTVLAVVAISGCREGELVHRWGGNTMGTTFEVKVVGEAPDRHLVRLLAQELEDMDRQMSTWRPDSEISRFNASTSLGWQPISPDFLFVLQQAVLWSDRTGGALDMTLEDLSAAWGFRDVDRIEFEPPPAEKISELLRHRGMDRFELQTDPPAIRKLDPGVKLDVSALAKGFAVDRFVKVLTEHGHERVLVEIGGEIRARGTRSGGGPWHIGIEPPDGSDAASSRSVMLRDEAVATSGDYRNWVGSEDQRLGHVLDPRTGRPADSGVVSATVIADDALTADALATAFMVMAPHESLELADELGLAMMLVVGDRTALRVAQSMNWKRRSQAEVGGRR